MANYVDWEYYSSLFSQVNEDTFDSLIDRAETEMKLRTFKFKLIAVQSTDDYYTNIQNCVCEIINKLNDFDNTNAGKGIKSASNDGYSETYNNVTVTDCGTEIDSICRKWIRKLGVC